MTCRRTAGLAATALCAAWLAAVGPVASAVPFQTPAPTPQQLAEARARVDQAQRSLAAGQDQAEQAAEDFNDAQVRAQAAAAASAAAAQTSAAARVVAAEADAASEQAQQVAATAAQAAADASAEQARAAAAARAAQLALDRMAAGAYRSGGNLALVSAMLDADPLTYETGREMINRADEYQKNTSDTLAASRILAEVSAERAVNAERLAAEQAEQVRVRARAAADAALRAREASAAAAGALASSTAAAATADAAKQRALAFVAAAEQQLGAASANAADLAAKAEQARREAAAFRQQPAGAAPVSGSAAAIAISYAYRQIGVPYAWGGGTANGPSEGFAQGKGTIGFDCSGLTLYAYAHAGIRLDHSSRSQYFAGRRISSRADLAPGDLMFFATNTGDPGTIHHVSIYLGNDRMIEAPHTGDVVKVSSSVRRDFIGGVRLGG